MEISTLIKDYRESLEVRHLSERTIHTYVSYVEVFDKFLRKINVRDMKDITREMVSKYQTSLCTKNEYNKNLLCVQTQSSRMVAVMSFFRFLHMIHLDSDNV